MTRHKGLRIIQKQNSLEIENSVRGGAINECNQRKKRHVGNGVGDGVCVTTIRNHNAHHNARQHHGFDKYFSILSNFIGNWCGAYDTRAILCICEIFQW